MFSKKVFFLILVIAVSFLSACEKKAVCTLTPETGNCFAAFPRYYFNNSTKKCEEFTWGGCGGLVPFETKEECEMCGCK